MYKRLAPRKVEKVANAVQTWISEHTEETVLFAADEAEDREVAVEFAEKAESAQW